jgi:hypothetical protein
MLAIADGRIEDATTALSMLRASCPNGRHAFAQVFASALHVEIEFLRTGIDRDADIEALRCACSEVIGKPECDYPIHVLVLALHRTRRGDLGAWFARNHLQNRELDSQVPAQLVGLHHYVGDAISFPT